MKKLILLFIALLFLSCSQNDKQERQGTLIDLTYSFDSESIYWPTADNFKHDTVAYGINDKGYFYSSYNYFASEHGGTHIDAPIHFAEAGKTIDQIEPKDFFGNGILIDVSKKVNSNSDYLFSIQDFEDWEKVNGIIPDGAIILLYSGWGKYYNNPEKYLGTIEKGSQAIAQLHFPGLSPEAAEWLSTKRKVKMVGIDTPSIDYGQSTMFETHRILFKNDIYAIENVANLDKLPQKDFKVYVFPMKIKGGSGSPVRIVAEI